MKYLLLAWSEGNVAARAGQQKRACPYQIGPMRDAWMKGFDWKGAVLDRHKHPRQRLAA